MPPTDSTPPPAEGQPYCVLVVGMHRAGTSAVASALGELGLALPRAGDLVGPGFGNELGHFESHSLMAICDEVLACLGGTWDLPPAQALGPEECWDEELRLLVAKAAQGFEAAFDARDRAICWKDPRSALLLPFWRRAISRPMAAVLAVRDPLEVAMSLDRRNALGLPTGLALWERYYRRALAGLEGLPVYVSWFEEAIGEPDAWKAELAGWLRSLAVAVTEAELPFRKGLRHEVRSAAPSGVLLEPQQRLADELAAMTGSHERFSHEPSCEESPWTAKLLQDRHDLERLWRGLEWLGEELLDGLPASSRLHPPGVLGHLPRDGALEPGTGERPYPLDATSDRARYATWLGERGDPVRLPPLPGPLRAATNPPKRRGLAPPRFSVVVPCYRPAIWAFERCVASVLGQDFDDWELLICDDASNDALLTRRLGELAGLDRRIRVTTRASNGGISAATNDAAALGTGRFLVFLDQDDELAAGTLRRLAEVADEQPGAALLYSDEDKIDEHGMRFMPSFKPDWSPDLLLSNAFMCHVLVVRRSLVDELGGLRSDYDGAQDYDLMLRATEQLGDAGIVHVPEVLYHWRTMAGSASGDASAKPWAFAAGHRALADALVRRGIAAEVVDHPSVPGSYHVLRRPASGHLVSAVIPFRDEPALLADCYRSFVRDPGYEDFELLLVDNDSALPETRALLGELSGDQRVRLLEAPGPFDWVRINNEAAGKARGDILLFLNNDIEATSPGWLAAMIAQAEREDVGAVGARLLFPDGTIQHAGVAVGLCFGAGHLLQGASGSAPGYLSLASLTRNTSAVTGACLMTRRAAFEELGGFDRQLPIAFSDIDYCLRARERGLLVVYTPLAELVHHESKSRGHSDDAAELPYFRNRWRSLMLAGDPYYNPNLGRFDCHCRLPTEEEEENWVRFRSMLGVSSKS